MLEQGVDCNPELHEAALFLLEEWPIGRRMGPNAEVEQTADTPALRDGHLGLGVWCSKPTE
jgi:hypothetical protein